MITNDEGGAFDVVAEVQQHKPKRKSLIDKAKAKMQEYANDDDGETEEKKKSRSAPGYIRPQQREELASLVSGLLILLIASSNVPDEVAPDTDEINGVSNHLVKILARHVDLSKAMTGDVLDIIGIIAIMSGWYTRVAPALSQMRKERDAKKKAATQPPTPTRHEAVSNFLDNAAVSGGDVPIEQ